MNSFEVGTRVVHRIYGPGVVVDKRRDSVCVSVVFDNGYTRDNPNYFFAAFNKLALEEIILENK